MSLLSLLDKSCNVETQTAALDATRASVPTVAARLTAVPCALRPLRPQERREFARDDSLVYHCLITATDIAATTADRINIGGTLYAVIASSVASDTNIDPTTVCRTIISRRR